ncbi:hypothetical protein CDAR_451091 [Caerostris darwini]|uniref:Uncharacterized protein n=1 Tax=Caerostris darwini TaxID=1538125 RepID=A0AAV4PQ09_9ARAC|nr:hypothetical protein CDAR_451091 [Caerostris darwini]
MSGIDLMRNILPNIEIRNMSTNEMKRLADKAVQHSRARGVNVPRGWSSHYRLYCPQLRVREARRFREKDVIPFGMTQAECVPDSHKKNSSF